MNPQDSKEIGLFSNFAAVFDRAVHLITHEHGLDDFQQLLTILETYVTGWLANKPTKESDLAIVQKVMTVLISQSLPKDEKFHPLKGQLAFLRAQIHESGFNTIKKNLKQANVDYADAVQCGHQRAIVKLGDNYFALAQLGKQPISSNPEFDKAMQTYSQGDAHCKVKLYENCFQQLMRDDFEEGKLSEAIGHAKIILAEIKLNPLLAAKTDEATMQDSLQSMQEFQQGMNDAQIIGGAFLRAIDGKTIAEMEETFVNKIKNPDQNPVYHYYYGTLLGKMAKVVKYEKMDQNEKEKKIAELNKLSTELLARCVDAKNYPASIEPLIDYVKAMGRHDRGEDRKETIETLERAIKNGCYLAFSLLADQYAPDSKQAETLYGKAAAAGEARGQFRYYQVALSKRVLHAFKDHSPEEGIAYCEKTLTLLKAAQNNPFTLASSQEYLLKQIALINSFINDHVHFFVVKEDEPFLAKNPQLKQMITDYQKTDQKDCAHKMILAKKIKQELTDLMLQPQNDDAKKLMVSLRDCAKAAIYYYGHQQYEIALQAREKLPRWQRVADYVHFLAVKKAKAGKIKTQDYQLKPNYYSETIDPKHRLPELFQVWANLPTKKNYFKWLQEFDSFNAPSMAVQYHDEFSAARFIIDKKSPVLQYRDRKTPVIDGSYLYVYTKKRELLLANEAQEAIAKEIFHHSSFVSGARILCGGDIVVKNGKIVHVTNASGHYRPDIFALLRFFGYLNSYHQLTLDADITFSIQGIPKFIIGKANNLSKNAFRNLVNTCAQLNVLNIDVVDPIQVQEIAAEENKKSRDYLPVIAYELQEFNAQFVAKAKTDAKGLAPYHSLLPTVEQVQTTPVNSPLAFYSDHLPLIANAPIDAATSIRVITWNVLLPNAGSGYYPVEEQHDTQMIRAKRCISALVKMIDAQKPDAIVLQEYYYHDPNINLNDLFEKTLAEKKYQILADNTGRFLIYNAETLSLESQATFALPKEPRHMATAVLTAAFKHISSKKQFVLHNGYFEHDEFPERTEDFIAELMKASITHEYTAVFLAGDFNNRYAPKNVQNGTLIVNNVVTALYRELIGKQQGCDFTDGFYFQNADHPLSKAETVNCLNPSNGIIATRGYKPNFPVESVQSYELCRPRPALSREHRPGLLNGLPAWLQGFIKQYQIQLGLACNALNQQMMYAHCKNKPLANYVFMQYFNLICANAAIKKLYEVSTRVSMNDDQTTTAVVLFIPPEDFTAILEAVFALPMQIISFKLIYQVFAHFTRVDDNEELMQILDVLSNCGVYEEPRNPVRIPAFQSKLAEVMKADPEGTVATAWNIAKQHYQTTNSSDKSLMKEIDDYLEKKRGLVGSIFFNRAKMHTEIAELLDENCVSNSK